MRLAHTIAFRLFLVLATVQTVILIALTYATVRVQQSHLMESVVASANRVSDVIARSTRYSMLLNRKEDVHQIISSLSGEPGIEGLRIYNKQGEIIFATHPADIHTVVDVNAEACVSCHGSGSLAEPHSENGELSRIFTKPDGNRVLGLITPIRNERECSNAACHAHPTDKTILGVLDVKMSLSNVDQRLEESKNQLLLLSGGAVLLVALVSGGFIWSVLRRPVNRLMNGMAMVSSGRLDHRIPETSSDEIGQLARSFNTMTAELARARSELTDWSNTLEEKVREKTADLERAHKQMVKVEKMASLGSLAATVAHELNNPLEGILTFAKLLIKRIKKTALPAAEVETYTTDLQLVADEAQRCGNIVKNLLVFSRQKGGSFQTVAMRSIVDRCALLMNHHASMHGVTMTVECPDDITLECDASQIQQALLALMVNAVEAMSSGGGRQQSGRLLLSVARTAGQDAVSIAVADTGPGMTEEIKAQIFEPFFTTKSEGKGVGLGLAVVYGIVEGHHGTIDVRTSPGEGATFTITLPIKQPVAKSAIMAPPPTEGVST